MEIFIHRDGQDLGPYSPREIRDRIASGQLTRTDMAWYETLPAWVPLSELRLPPEEEATLVPAPVRMPTISQSRLPAVPAHQATKICPFCAEEIKANALKCKYCGEVLDPKLRAIEESKRAVEAARRISSGPVQTPSNVNVKVNVGGPRPVIVVQKNSSCLSSCGCLILFLIGLFIFLAIMGQHPN